MEKTELTKEDVDGKMTWREVIRYYWPEKTNEECEYILWNETCYPFSDETTCHQIYNLYLTQLSKPEE